MTDLVPAPTGASVQLSVNRRVGTAPAGFFFSVAAAGFEVEDPYFDVRYKWTFGDPGYYTRHDTDDLPWGKYFNVDGTVILVDDGSVPTGGTVRFLGNNKDVAYGPHVCHVFEAPGEYTITCEVRKRDHAPVLKTMKVLVENPEPYFAGTATICVSPSGNFEGAPHGARQAPTFAAAMKLAGQKGPENLRVLFCRGETHATPRGRRDRAPSRVESLRRLHWGAFGTGAPPVYGPHNIFLDAAPQGEACAWGLDYQGGYRADDPWGISPLGRGGFAAKGTAFTTIWDCGMKGGDTLVSIGGRGSDIVVGNAFGTDWHDYGIFANRRIARVGLCGVWLKQNRDTVIGEGMHEKQPPFYQDGAPFRTSSLRGPLALNLCDLRSVGSWAGRYQPSLRVGRSPDGSDIEEAVMDRIRGENGRMLITGNSGKVAYPRRYLWDKIYSIPVNEAGGARAIFSPGVSGLEFRNVIVALPDMPRIGGGVLDYWIWRGPPAGEGGVDDPKIAELGLSIYNCTLVDLRSSGNFSGAMTLYDPADLEAFGFVRVENNVIYVPDREDPTETGDAPLELTTMWDVTNEGMRYQDDPFAPIFATKPETAAFYRPLPDSDAFTGATGEEVAVDDFFGRIRGLDTSRGAIDAAG